MKFVGKIGFWEGDQDVGDDVYESRIVERDYVGDILKHYRKFVPGESQNDDFSLVTTISVLADTYALSNWHSIRYVYWNGVYWSANSDISYPRVNVELGGVYNGETAETIE